MKPTPFLVIDAGNSRIKWALIDAHGTTQHKGAFEHAALSAAAPRTTLGWASLPTPASVWISNVAGPTVAAQLAALIDLHWPQLPCTTIHAQAKQCGVTNAYTRPDQLGSDRWAGMIGAHAAFPAENLLIVTLGTATTLESLRADGVFTGGLIVPGWALMMRSLGEHTAQLPTLSHQGAAPMLASHRMPTDINITNTPDAIVTGCLLAQVGLIERTWHMLCRERNTTVRLVLNGGTSESIAPLLTAPYTRHDGLVLSGLAFIAAQSIAEMKMTIANPTHA